MWRARLIAYTAASHQGATTYQKKKQETRRKWEQPLPRQPTNITGAWVKDRGGAFQVWLKKTQICDTPINRMIVNSIQRKLTSNYMVMDSSISHSSSSVMSLCVLGCGLKTLHWEKGDHFMVTINWLIVNTISRLSDNDNKERQDSLESFHQGKNEEFFKNKIKTGDKKKSGRNLTRKTLNPLVKLFQI